MAKKSFNQRNPAFKWIFLLAIVLAIPLTLYSFNNVSTQTQSEAFRDPGGGGGSLAAPTGLGSSVWYCKRIGYNTGELTEFDTANFWWNPVPNATSYTLYYRIYSNVYKYAYKSVSLTTTNKLIGDIYRNLNGRRIQWYVKAHRSTVSSTSITTTTPAAFQSCGS